MNRIVLTLALIAGAAVLAQAESGAVYTITNEASGNRLVVIPRDNDGTLGAAHYVPTGGLGSGSGLGSQGAVTLSHDGRRIYAVNAGSNSVSVFRVTGSGLLLTGVYASGGSLPTSVTESHGLVYVLNAGGTANVSGFTAQATGALSPIAGSTYGLSAGSPGPAQVQFSPDGMRLVVTEKATNIIDSWVVLPGGWLGGMTTTPSAGVTPFGFDFDTLGRLFVSEAFGGATDASALSSYAPSGNGWNVVSPSVATNQTAACWAIVSKDGRYAYTTNAGSESISGYRIAADGTVTLLDENGRTGVTGTGSHPTDLATSANGRYLYSLSPANHSIAEFRINADGSLARIGILTGMPTSAVGLAAK